MERIIIPKPNIHPLTLYNPKGKLLGTIFLESQFYEIRCQILEKRLGDGYYFMNEKHKIPIDKYGRILRETRKYIPFKYEEYLDRLLRGGE